MKLFDRIRAAVSVFRDTAPKAVTFGEFPTAGEAQARDTILEALIAQGIIPPGSRMKVSVIPLNDAAKTKMAQGGAPTAEMPVDPGETWTRWRMNAKQIAVPGWSACRFANKWGWGDEVRWVYGVVQGPWGLWRQPYPVCHHPLEGDDEEEFEPNEILYALTHLPSGYGMGIFKSATVAAEAVKAILPLVDWENAPETDSSLASIDAWRDLCDKAKKAWTFNGITQSIDWHAHNGPGGEELPIWDIGELAPMNEIATRQ